MFGFGLSTQERFIIKKASDFARYNNINSLKCVTDTILADMAILNILSSQDSENLERNIQYLSQGVYAWRCATDLHYTMMNFNQKVSAELMAAMLNEELKMIKSINFNDLKPSKVSIRSAHEYIAHQGREADDEMARLQFMSICEYMGIWAEKRKNRGTVADALIRANKGFPTISSIVKNQC